MMAHAQKPDFVFRRNGRVHLHRRGRQFTRLLAAEVCASALVMLDTPRSEVVWEYWLSTAFASFPFTSPPVRHRVPSGFRHALLPYLQKPAPDRTPRQMCPDHTFISYMIMVHFKIYTRRRLRHAGGLFPFRFPANISYHLFCRFL
jgi:hypothetical protein